MLEMITQSLLIKLVTTRCHGFIKTEILDTHVLPALYIHQSDTEKYQAYKNLTDLFLFTIINSYEPGKKSA